MLGAFGAHGLKASLAKHPDGAARMKNWDTAAHYHLIHSVALLAIGFKQSSQSATPLNKYFEYAGWLWATGVTFFSGSIYLLVLDSEKRYTRPLIPITPLGGSLLISGWLCVYLAAS
ncbi:DUF423-domain-containing protein [Gonapodya prolifera JEL478]|uniref:DUF423-domain-containing protein n=1 Tax=Gonapodya prolifera (strain JEL478) TaxID=1344416 RepID=A0A139A9X6_GONPJ|nr:DUF423-domain-containing protein [Gonapodya prolifera JEL478]|eukprot:KXS13537.1 DUF423-domain-containing protein [Gonapodya prolifera JEL478]